MRAFVHVEGCVDQSCNGQLADAVLIRHAQWSGQPSWSTVPEVEDIDNDGGQIRVGQADSGRTDGCPFHSGQTDGWSNG